VMFCLMDVSGSMGEREKDLAKRFFVLLHLFLKRRYEKVDIVFIRHTHDAQEVDEQTFFYSRQSGGTIVSTALEKMLEIQHERYTTSDWNIYAAQASDGYTQSGDAKRCVELLETELMPLCQYYAYIEILDEREMEVFSSEDAGAELWRAYRTVAEGWKALAGQLGPEPVQFSATSHTPAALRQTLELGRKPSPGQLALFPGHVSAASHTPADDRQVVPVWKPSAGQMSLAPVQFSAVSQIPAVGRHTVVAGSFPSAFVGSLVPSAFTMS